MDRVHEFQRVELVWLGTPEQVEKIRDTTLEISQNLADLMELEWYTEVGDDPFYLEGRKSEERGIEFPDVPKYEMRLVVPGADKEWLQFQPTYTAPTLRKVFPSKKPIKNPVDRMYWYRHHPLVVRILGSEGI